MEAMEPKVIKTTIDKLVPDDLNANKGTQYGTHLIEKSFQEHGAGRSILLDKNNRIIAGNKSTEGFAAAGMEKVLIIETDGKTLVAVKRKDIDLDSKEGREMALADNATSKANLDWNEEAIQQITEQWEIAPEDWGISDEWHGGAAQEEKDPFDDEGIEKKNQFGVIVMCSSEQEQEKTFKALENLGYTCKIVVV